MTAHRVGLRHGRRKTQARAGRAAHGPSDVSAPPPQYVRISQDTPPSVIYHLMTQHWGLDVPNLLISVTGGAKDFHMKPRLKSIFRRGLVKVAQTTGSPRAEGSAQE